MLHKTLMLAVASVLTCVYATSASAELCVNIGGGGSPAVLRTKYKLQFPFDPTQQNSCEPISGFEDTKVPGGAGGRISGSICIDDDQLTYHYTYHNAEKNLPWYDAYFESGLCVFDVRHTPAETGGNVQGRCRGTLLSGTTSPPAHQHQHFVRDGWIWNCGPIMVPRTNLPY